jgi:hypothetical protein
VAAGLGITERSVYAIVADLAQAGYVIKQKDGRRNRYQIEARLPLPEPGTREPAISEVLVLLLGDTGGHDGPPGLAAAAGRPAWTAQMSSPPGSMATASPAAWTVTAGRPWARLVTKLHSKANKRSTILEICC